MKTRQTLIVLSLLAFSCTKTSDKSSDRARTPAATSQSNDESSVLAPKLTSANCTDPDLSKVNVGETFMLCDGTLGEGTQVVSTPISPDPWDVRYGVTVGTTTGRLKVNCRNMVGYYDKNNGLSSNNGGGYTGGSDEWDTVDDYNYDGAASGDYPSTNPWSGGDGHFCGYNLPSDPTWERVTTTPATSGAESVFKDRISGLNWTRGTDTSAMDWDSAEGNSGTVFAIEYCNDLDHGGMNTWRLPTQKELIEAYARGIQDLDDEHTPTDNLGDLDASFWSSSTRSFNPLNAWFVTLSTGNSGTDPKTDSHPVLCVTP